VFSRQGDIRFFDIGNHVQQSYRKLPRAHFCF
jgi:hypothetical protein